MIEILHTFLAGITFTGGVLFGAILCRMVAEKNHKAMRDEIREISEKIDARLYSSLACYERMALAMETLVELKRTDLNEN